MLRIKNAGIFLGKNLAKKVGKFNRKSIIGLILLLSPYVVGVITRQSASISNQIPNNIKLIMPENDISLKCDNEKIQVVFYNLITNAIQSIGEKTPGEILIKFTKNEDNVRIDVQNSGSSIPDELLSKIFEPLFTTKPHGIGLGLPSCKNIIGQHGGTITVRNNPTTFTILLPKDIEKSNPVTR